LQRQQPLLSRTAGDKQGTDGEVGSVGEPLASINLATAASFAEWVRHWTGSNSVHCTLFPLSNSLNYRLA
jgi:hypothetical protein